MGHKSTKAVKAASRNPLVPIADDPTPPSTGSDKDVPSPHATFVSRASSQNQLQVKPNRTPEPVEQRVRSRSDVQLGRAASPVNKMQDLRKVAIDQQMNQRPSLEADRSLNPRKSPIFMDPRSEGINDNDDDEGAKSDVEVNSVAATGGSFNVNNSNNSGKKLAMSVSSGSGSPKAEGQITKVKSRRRFSFLDQSGKSPSKESVAPLHMDEIKSPVLAGSRDSGHLKKSFKQLANLFSSGGSVDRNAQAHAGDFGPLSRSSSGKLPDSAQSSSESEVEGQHETFIVQTTTPLLLAPLESKVKKEKKSKKATAAVRSEPKPSDVAKAESRTKEVQSIRPTRQQIGSKPLGRLEKGLRALHNTRPHTTQAPLSERAVFAQHPTLVNQTSTSNISYPTPRISQPLIPTCDDIQQHNLTTGFLVFPMPQSGSDSEYSASGDGTSVPSDSASMPLDSASALSKASSVQTTFYYPYAQATGSSNQLYRLSGQSGVPFTEEPSFTSSGGVPFDTSGPSSTRSSGTGWESTQSESRASLKDAITTHTLTPTTGSVYGPYVYHRRAVTKVPSDEKAQSESSSADSMEDASEPVVPTLPLRVSTSRKLAPRKSYAIIDDARGLQDSLNFDQGQPQGLAAHLDDLRKGLAQVSDLRKGQSPRQRLGRQPSPPEFVVAAKGDQGMASSKYPIVTGVDTDMEEESSKEILQDMFVLDTSDPSYSDFAPKDGQEEEEDDF